MATVKTPARRAKHVKLVQIVYYYCWLASSDNLLQWTYNYVFGKYFFASSHHSLREATRKPFINLVSLSQAYHFITYNRSSTHIDNSTIPRRWKCLLWTTSDSLRWAIYCRSRDQRRTDHPGWSGLLYQYQGREPPKCPRYRHICSS